MERRIFIDRKDAHRCDNVTGLNQILIDLKPKRSLGELYINQKIDVTNLVEYMQKIKNNDNKITYFHMFTTAVGKLIYNRPLLNRFISNRHVYEHNNITISFVMKIDFNDKSEEIMVLIPISENDDLFTISKKISQKVENIRHNKDNGEGANQAIQIIGKLPNIIRVPIVSIFKFCDNHGILPSFLIKDNLYYSSTVLSNLGTFNCGGIYHNITDFGTCSSLMTIGNIKEELVLIDGKKCKKYFCEFGITIDERIADGFYFIKSIHMLEYLLNNPELLEEKISKKIEMDSTYEKERK